MHEQTEMMFLKCLEDITRTLERMTEAIERLDQTQAVMLEREIAG